MNRLKKRYVECLEQQAKETWTKYKYKFANIEKITRNRIVGRMASIESMIKRPLKTSKTFAHGIEKMHDDRYEDWLTTRVSFTNPNDVRNFGLWCMKMIFSRAKEDYLDIIQERTIRVRGQLQSFRYREWAHFKSLFQPLCWALPPLANYRRWEPIL